MPKVPTTDYGPTDGDNSSAPVLKRNQACHQCRRRKLKCDAKRPCATCKRSHRNAVNHAPPGTEVPPLECTFDEVPENGAPPHSVPKNRYERLENRISELETLLKIATQNSPSVDTPPYYSNSTGASNLSHPHAPPISPINTVRQSQDFSGGTSVLPFNPSSAQSDAHNLSPLIPAHISPINTPPQDHLSNLDALGGQGNHRRSNYATQVLWPNWPHNLPAIELLQHLVQSFFAFQPHAGHIFHASTFIASLSLPPAHISFPHVAILHSICAVGSFYTVAVPPPILPDFSETPADDLFQTAYKRRKALPDSFGEKHANFARLAIEESTALGERLFECQQATTILTWFYHCHAKWADMFLMTGRAMRYLVPIGLNMCPPFHSISKSLRAPSIISPARTVVEDETRRNTFWLTYATERLYSSGNGWAMSLDDQDISQLLPVTTGQFEQGILVAPKNRQWAHSPGVLLNHPPEQTDSFILYIKSSMLMSRVKTFNLRFRAKNFAGDPTMVPSPDQPAVEFCSTTQYIDPRNTIGFKEVDDLVSNFVASFPKDLKDPVRGNVVDTHLLLAILSPNVAKILLHDPHADLARSGCISAKKILEAARAILDQLYAVWSTSYDMTLLDNFCCFAFFMTGRVLVRHVQRAKEADDQSQLLAFRTELEFIRIALAKIGSRLPLAYRYAKMLDDIVLQSIGILDELTLPSFPSSAVPLGTNYVPHDNNLEILLGNGGNSLILS